MTPESSREAADSIPAALRNLTEQLASCEPDEAPALLETLLADGGILHAVNGLLEEAGELIDRRLEAGPYIEGNPLHPVWQALNDTVELLHAQRQHLRDAPQALRGPTAARDGNRPPAPRRGEDWVPPIAARETAASLDAIGERLDGGSPPYIAALLMEPVLHPDDGILVRLSNLLAAASTYAQRHNSTPELWQNLGRGSQSLQDWADTLGSAPLQLAGPAKRNATPTRPVQQHPAPPPATGTPGRSR